MGDERDRFMDHVDWDFGYLFNSDEEGWYCQCLSSLCWMTFLQMTKKASHFKNIRFKQNLEGRYRELNKGRDTTVG